MRLTNILNMFTETKMMFEELATWFSTKKINLSLIPKVTHLKDKLIPNKIKHIFIVNSIISFEVNSKSLSREDSRCGPIQRTCVAKATHPTSLFFYYEYWVGVIVILVSELQ